VLLAKLTKSFTEAGRQTTGKAFLGMLGVFAEFETKLHRERQMEGVAKAAGVYKGRPPSIDPAVVKRLKEKGARPTEIAKELGIGWASVYRLVGEEPSTDTSTSGPHSLDRTKACAYRQLNGYAQPRRLRCRRAVPRRAIMSLDLAQLHRARPSSPQDMKWNSQWAALFAVASELCKRDYEVTLTLGNYPRFDIMARSPEGASFCVDVKGVRTKNVWVVERNYPALARDDLFYILAYVPEDQPNEYFILKQAEAFDLITDELKRLGRPLTHVPTGFLFSRSLPYANAWDKLPR
jgi:hypothetical protein